MGKELTVEKVIWNFDSNSVISLLLKPIWVANPIVVAINGVHTPGRELIFSINAADDHKSIIKLDRCQLVQLFRQRWP